ncbi:MAG TPA: amidohydrolase family protein [Nitrososphaerales archaeon]|nr:amidohydrolase family protein [Nitrososphaerales archaeon]
MLTVLKSGTLIDGSGNPPVENISVVIEGDKITAVERENKVETPSGATIIDAAGMTIMPGLIDAHVHLTGNRTMDPSKWVNEPPQLRTIRAAADLKTFLEWGFTSVRDLGSSDGIFLRNAVNEGTITGPRIVTAYKLISQTAGHGDIHFVPEAWLEDIDGSSIIADGVDECRKAVRWLNRVGSDCIKICTTGGGGSEKDGPHQPQFTIEEIKAMTEEAHRVGKKVASHAQGLQGIKNAITGGVDTIEHGTYIDDECCEALAQSNKIMVPTLVNVKLYVALGAKSGMPDYALKKANESIKYKAGAIKRARSHGVKLALGSDTSGAYPARHGLNNVKSLQYYVEDCGMSPMEAIVSATKNAAEALDRSNLVGTVESGKLADLILVEGNPAKDITTLCNQDAIKMVMKGGNICVDRGVTK